MEAKDLGILGILPAILPVIHQAFQVTRQAILLVIRKSILLVIRQTVLLVICQGIQRTARQIPKVPPLEIPWETHQGIPMVILQIQRMTKASRTRSKCRIRWTWVWRWRTRRWSWTSPWTRTSNRTSRSSWTARTALHRGRHLTTGMWVDDFTSWILTKMIVSISWWLTDSLDEEALEACFRLISINLMTDDASLRHVFLISKERKVVLWRKIYAKWRIGGLLIDLLPVETRNSCFSEASSVTTLSKNNCMRFSTDALRYENNMHGTIS